MKKPAIGFGLLALVLSVFLAGCGDENNVIGYFDYGSTMSSQPVAQGQFEVATRFVPSVISFLAGRYITEVNLNTPDNCTITSCKVRIRSVGSGGEPGAIIREEDHTLSPGYNSFKLNTPYLLSATTDIFVGVSITNSTGQTVDTFCYDPATNEAGYNYLYDSTATGNPWSVFPNNWWLAVIVRPK